MSFETSIAADARRVFDIVSDLRAYDRWLPYSNAFNGTTEVSDGPICAGTTYAERSPGTVRAGKVIAFDAPRSIAFEQPMHLTTPILKLCGYLDIRVDYALTAVGDTTQLVRTVRIEPRGVIGSLETLMKPAFRKENQRVIDALKTYAERVNASIG